MLAGFYVWSDVPGSETAMRLDKAVYDIYRSNDLPMMQANRQLPYWPA
jgi:hypothetical protein